jgi:FtsH-binding integral membrane protein
MSEETTEVTAEAGTRPTFLTVLCILTFIGSGLGALFMLLATVGMGALMESIPGMEAAMGGGTAYFAVGTILAAASLYGAIQMWKLKKMGFFIYAGANGVGIIVPLLFGMPFGIAGAIIPILFIVLYYLNVKHMS